MITKEEFLKKLEIFAGLEEEELADLARITDEVEFENGAIIAYQRDVADKLIMVRSGRLYASQVDNQGIVRDSRSYLPGDCFEDTYLFSPQTHQATVRGSGNGRLYFIEREKFLVFLETYPDLVEVLNLSEEAAIAAENISFAQPNRQIQALRLLPDELIEYYARRTIWLLPLRLGGPIILLLIWAGFLQWQPWFSGTWVIILTAIPTLLTAFFVAWRALDWYNDYFVVTNKHLIHREYSLRHFRSVVNKTPVDQVQSVEVEKPGLLATILNTGTAQITTAAQSGVIRFDYIDDPIEIKEIINELREKRKAMDFGRTQATMRASLEEHFEVKPAYTTVEDPEAEDEEEEETGFAPLGWLAALANRLSRGVRSRVVDGDVITYRKQMFTLFGQIWMPVLAGLLLATGVALVPWMTAAIIMLVLLILDFFWLIWQFEDWRNDTFQLTDRYVIDIDRRPFGFGESRKQAELGNVQNVNAKKPGLLATLFNFGDVNIETAGASADITFENVVNPNLIQSDIFQRRDAYRQKQRLRESEDRRREYAVLVDVYRQEFEEGRIPRRMPPEDEEQHA